MQRSRVLAAAKRVVFEYGYEGMSVARMTGGAGVSRRTFYDLFEDREDCFLTLFMHAVEVARDRVTVAYVGEGSWADRVRGALGELLGLLDEQPALGRVLLVDSLRAGSRVLAYRAQVLGELREIIDRDGAWAGESKGVAKLAGEGVVGGTIGVIHNRLLLEGAAPSLSALVGELTSMVVLPYLGPRAARRELERLVPSPARAPSGEAFPRSSRGRDPLEGLEIRVTYRTLRVLGVIAEQPDASNRMVADAAGISDQGQVSRLLARLERLGLIENTGPGQPSGEPNAWKLTPRGQEIHHATNTQPSVKIVTPRGARPLLAQGDIRP
jgi:AcrR family transcriptional regulator